MKTLTKSPNGKARATPGETPLRATNRRVRRRSPAPATAPSGNDPVLAQLAGLKTATTPQLKDQWRSLFGTEPPRYNRRFLESRLAYRVQELAYGGLKPETIRRLEKLGEEIEQERLKGGRGKGRKSSLDNRPIAGTRLIREWKGVEHTVVVRHDAYEWEGRPYKSLSPIAFAITGTRWNGLERAGTGWCFSASRTRSSRGTAHEPEGCCCSSCEWSRSSQEGEQRSDHC